MSSQPLDRRRHDRIVVAENSQLPRTPLTVRIWRAERNQRAHRTGRARRVASRNGAAEAVSDQMDAVAAGFFIGDASELRGGISPASAIAGTRNMKRCRNPPAEYMRRAPADWIGCRRSREAESPARSTARRSTARLSDQPIQRIRADQRACCCDLSNDCSRFHFFRSGPKS